MSEACDSIHRFWKSVLRNTRLPERVPPLSMWRTKKKTAERHAILSKYKREFLRRDKVRDMERESERDREIEIDRVGAREKVELQDLVLLCPIT